MGTGAACRFRLLCNLFRFLIRNPGCSYQQPVGVDPVGGAGHKGTAIFTLPDPQQAGIAGKHSIDFRYLIRQNFIQHMEVKYISNAQLLQIREHGLEMKLIDAEYTFDNNKVLFYFTADGRIDFRQLVKDLAAIFKTRIELRQIGVRDETKILGGIGICGRCLCCHTYLSEFAPVSIKMAKEQNLSLNQTKISGVCGRLMCCLKNEQETYEELNKKLPGLGDTVTTPDGLTGTVHSVNVLRQRVKVIVEINDEKEIQEFPVDDLKFRPRKKKVKVSEKELKELGNLEDKKGDSKLND